MKGAKSLLPWYVNGSLDVEERQVVETWLQGDDDAAERQRELQQFSAMMNRQEDRMPPRRVDARLFSQIRKQPSRWSGFLQWSWGFPVAALFFALLWLIVQPGAQLQWSVQGDTEVAVVAACAEHETEITVDAAVESQAPLGHLVKELVNMAFQHPCAAEKRKGLLCHENLAGGVPG